MVSFSLDDLRDAVIKMSDRVNSPNSEYDPIDASDWCLGMTSALRNSAWQQSRHQVTAWSQWNAYLNQICHDRVLEWLHDHEIPATAQVDRRSQWAFVNGSVLKVGETRWVVIPSEAIDLPEMEIPQEWIDIPSWVADYYVSVQISADLSNLRLVGYATHQQIKQQGNYDDRDRTYILAVDQLTDDFNLLWLTYARYTPAQTRAPVAAIAPLTDAHTDSLIQRLGDRANIWPRLSVPFAFWAAILETSQGCDRLFQVRQGQSGLTRLQAWLKGQISEGWQSLEGIVLQPAIAVRNSAIASVEENTPQISRAKVLAFPHGSVGLVMGVTALSPSEVRVHLQIRSVGESSYLPGGTQVRLLSETDQELGKSYAAMTETIQLQFRANYGEYFKVEILCNQQTQTEAFVV